MMRIIWHTVRRTTNEILGVKGLLSPSFSSLLTAIIMIASVFITHKKICHIQ